MIIWRFETRNIVIDKEAKTISYKGSKICSIAILGNKFAPNFDREWQQWDEFFQSSEIQGLIQRGQEILDKASGIGKGSK
eukprot:5227394-Karenia_brevis.AAC.1